jgi:hypothetical protein
VGDRKSRSSLFDKPLTGDWVFWVYGLFIFIYSIGSFNDYYAGASLTSLSSPGLIAASIDLVIFPFIGALIFPTSLILIARRIARKKNDRHEPSVVDGDRSEGTGFELNESEGFRAKLPTITMKQAFAAGTALVILLTLVQVSQKNDLPKLFANSQGAPTASEIEAVPEPGAVKRAPTQETLSSQPQEIAPIESPTKSAAPKPTKTPSPTKSASPKPEPTPVASWWPAYFSPWGNTIAYKYGHSNGNCTNTEPSWQCQGYHYVEFLVTEPCAAFSVTFTDESGESYIAYFEQYVPTGPIFYDSTGDMTPQSPGRVTNITC